MAKFLVKVAYNVNGLPKRVFPELKEALLGVGLGLCVKMSGRLLEVYGEVVSEDIPGYLCAVLVQCGYCMKRYRYPVDPESISVRKVADNVA